MAVQKNTGIPYELFVKKVYSALQSIKQLPHCSNVSLQHNVVKTDSGGIDRQFDLYWEREEFGKIKKTILECKDYQNGVSIDRVDALIGKMVDFPDIIPVLVTSVKYQKGALRKAKNHNIEILVVWEEDEEKDWRDESGNPLIRKVIGTHVVLNPLCINRYSALIDKKLRLPNRRICVRNDLVYFGDTATGWRANMLDLSREMENIVDGYTNFPKTYRRMLSDGYEEYLGERTPILGFEVEYVYPPPTILRTVIEPIVEAVFEYVLTGQKEILMRFEDDCRDALKLVSLKK